MPCEARDWWPSGLVNGTLPLEFGRVDSVRLSDDSSGENVGLDGCVPCEDGVVACSLVDGWVREVGEVGDALIEIGSSQTENHLCEDACTSGVDEDNDGNVDADAECDSTGWP